MHKKVFSSLYFQVLLAITLGVFLGHVYPELGANMKPLGDGFVKLIKMIIAPVIFCTVVTGIAGMESMKAVGKTGASPHDEAPPFRDLHLRYDVADLTEGLVEGLVSGHPDMPEFEFTPEQADAVVAYLKSLETP